MRFVPRYFAISLLSTAFSAAAGQADSVRPAAIERYLNGHLRESFRARTPADTTWRTGRVADVTASGFYLLSRTRRYHVPFDSLSALHAYRTSARSKLLPTIGFAGGVVGGIVAASLSKDKAGPASVGTGPLVITAGFFAGVVTTASAGALWLALQPAWRDVPLASPR
jgi:hypothetical protein